MSTKTPTKRKESNKHICSGCLGEFDSKEIFVGKFPGKEYTTDYCEKCVKKLGIEEVVPYLKPRKPRTEVKKVSKTKKSTTSKTKNSTSKRKK